MEEVIMILDNPQAVSYLMEGEFYMPVEKTRINDIRYQGKYKKKILLLVNESLQPAILELMGRILKFAGLTEDDYALISKDDWGNMTIGFVVNSFRPVKIIAWGETLFPMLPVFSNEQYEGISIVTCVTLTALEKNPEAKKSLAAALKVLLAT